MIRDYLVFGGLVVYLYAMEGWLNRKGGMTVNRAVAWSLVYVCAAMAFAGWLYGTRGPGVAQTFLTAYALEKVLSVDNLMVFSMVFMYFDVPREHQHRVLHWGILGAVVTRLLFTVLGVSFMGIFKSWASLAFATVIAWSAIKIIRGSTEESVDHSNRWYSRAVRRFWPVYTENNWRGEFFVKVLDTRTGWVEYKHIEAPVLMHTRRAVTPVFLALVAIEVSDVMFSFDSVPTVIAVAKDPFIIYTAMIFAILGLRCLYFVLEALRSALHYMNVAVGVTLLYIAAKMVWEIGGGHISPSANLITVGAILGLGVAASLWRRNMQI